MIPTADFLFLVYQVTVERAKKSFPFVIRLSKYLRILKIRLTHIFIWSDLGTDEGPEFLESYANKYAIKMEGDLGSIPYWSCDFYFIVSFFLFKKLASLNINTLLNDYIAKMSLGLFNRNWWRFSDLEVFLLFYSI